MDLTTALAQIPGIGPVIPYVVGLVAVCAFAAQFLPPPSNATGWYARVYFVVNKLGQNSLHAANAASAPYPTPTQK